MTEEEIVERITKCKEKVRDYLEVGKTGYVRKYEEEIYKWEKLLDSVKPTEEDYRRGYNLLRQRIDKASNDLQSLMNDINTKTIIGLNGFLPRLEQIQDELIGGFDE